MVLDGVIGTPGHRLGDLGPLIAELLVLDEDRVVLESGRAVVGTTTNRRKRIARRWPRKGRVKTENYDRNHKQN